MFAGLFVEAADLTFLYLVQASVPVSGKQVSSKSPAELRQHAPVSALVVAGLLAV